MSRDARSLIESATRGDPAAIDELLERNLPRLLAFVQAKAGASLRSRESCSDLVQSACREVLQDLPQLHFDSEPAFRAFLFRAALRKIVDRARHHGASMRAMSAEQANAAEAPLLSFLTPSRDAASKEELARLESALSRLPDDYREAIVLRRIVGLGYDEIARELGRSEGAARNLVYRGLARVTELLQE